VARRTVLGCCPLDCPDTCAWEATVEGGRVVELRGSKRQPFTAGALCGKVNRYLDLLDGERVTEALVRRDGVLVPVPLEEALDVAAAGIRRAIDEHGAESVLPFFFAGTQGLLQAMGLPQRLLYALGTSRLDTTICTAAWRAAAKATFGASIGGDPEDLPRARLIIFWGANPLSTGMHVWKYVLAAQRAGAHVVCIDPLRSGTAERCDEHVAVHPGTDGALALALMRVIRDEGGVDGPWVAEHVAGWPELSERLDEWPAERAAAICRIDVETIHALGRRIAATRPTAINVGLGLQRHGGAGAAVRAIMAITALCGDFKHAGGGLSGLTGGHFPALPALGLAKRAGVSYPRVRTLNMSRLGAVLNDVDDPPVKALVVFNCNPAATSPDQLAVRRGLERDDLFTVVLEQRLTDTCAYADVVLPATMQPEHFDLHDAYGHLYLSWNEQAVEPPGSCLPNSELLRRLLLRLGVDDPVLHRTDLEVARELCDEAGVDLDVLRAEGFLRVGPARGSAPFAAGGFPTRSGRIELLDPLPTYVPPHEATDDLLAERFPLVLLAPAGRFFLNSTFAQLPWHRAKQGPPTVYLSPADAAARAIETGMEVRCFNDRGAWEGVAEVTDATRQGVAFTLKTQWPSLSAGGTNVNACTPERDADLAGAPTFHDNRVEVVGRGQTL
jgi:anaerobic selenocysteine-containing dehydrogenase